MAGEQRSFLKTIGMALAAALIAAVAGVLLAERTTGAIAALLATVAAGVGSACVLVAIGGCLVVVRATRNAQGLADLFLRANLVRGEPYLRVPAPRAPAALRRLWRAVFAPDALLVGDVVEVRTFDEIAASVDAADALDGLPFMPEMVRYTGRRAVVYRLVDKVYDYGRSSRLRRVEHTYLLTGLRCDGGAHGGCQAGCYLLWKSAWLKRVVGSTAAAPPMMSQSGDARTESVSSNAIGAGAQARAGATPVTYSCQYTEIAAASSPLSDSGIAQDLRPLLAGNLTLLAFAVAILSRLFNRAQELRGGAGFPTLPPSSATTTPLVSIGLRGGDAVRVRSVQQIAETLDSRSRNRGLWFDKEMMKHCGQAYPVLASVNRIIDVTSGRMLELRTPSIVLEGPDASGELLRFCAQHEHLFWREAWLVREQPAVTAPSSQQTIAAGEIGSGGAAVE